jgi:hypothetical protein
VDFFKNGLMPKVVQLTSSREVPNDVDAPFRISVGKDEVLEMKYGGSIMGGGRDACDFYHIKHFKNWQKRSHITIKVSPFYEYLVDIGYGLVLHPNGELIKSIPLSPPIRRCKSWAVRVFNPSDWKDAPIKTLEEVAELKVA